MKNRATSKPSRIRMAYFWVIDADIEVYDDFSFNFDVNPVEFDIVHIWKSSNEVNNLEYGNGGIKLLPKFIFDIERTKGIDITTSLSDQIKIIDQVVAIHKIAQSPYTAWRAGFREAVKLTKYLLEHPDDVETESRLKSWKYKGHDKIPYGSYTVIGAKAGYKFVNDNVGKPYLYDKINDYDWLYEIFKQSYPNLLVDH